VALPLHRIYFDKSRTYHSPDPADPSVTERVITIMLLKNTSQASCCSRTSRATTIVRSLVVTPISRNFMSMLFETSETSLRLAS
jgi:hypothetical protein